MTKDIDKFNDIIAEKIKIKEEELEFFKDKVIALDNQRELPLKLIKSLDKQIYDELESVNAKLEDLKEAYQARIDSGCRSDLFWRVVGITTGATAQNVTQTFHTLQCVRLSPNPYPRLSLTERSGSTRVGGLEPVVPSDDVTYITTSGKSTFNYAVGIGIDEDKLYGLKYYDEPYTKDIADTFVTSFLGRVSAASTEVTILASPLSGVSDKIKIGQNLVCDKNVFPLGFVEIVGISTVLGNPDYTVLERTATATAGLSTNRYKLSSISVTDGGDGYSLEDDAPTVTIGAPDAQTAIGTAIVSAAGTITSITLSNVGTGYTLAPTVTISTPFSVTAVGIATTGAGGSVVGFDLVEPGIGYSVAPSITFSAPLSGTTATATATIGAGGTVSLVTITNAGLGYTQNPTVTFSAPPLGTAIITATAVATTHFGGISNITIINPGAGYTTKSVYLPTVTFSDPLKVQAVGVSTISTSNTVSSVILTIPGEGYVAAPSVQIQSSVPDIASNRLTKLLIKDATIDFVSQPESNGSTPSFTVLISDEELVEQVKDLGIPFGTTMFSPQTIGIVTSSDMFGIGSSVRYDNSGYQIAKKTWRPELTSGPINTGRGTIPAVKEPTVGAGKIYYTLGLTFKPRKPSGASFVDAVEGDTITVLVSQSTSSFYWGSPLGVGPVPLSSYVTNCPSCSATVTNNVTNALTAATDAKSAIASGISDLNYKIAAVNLIRDDLMEINKQIFSYRTLIGQIISDIEKYQNQLSYTTTSSIKNSLP